MRLFGIAGYSGAGKTTLLEKLLPRLAACGLQRTRPQSGGTGEACCCAKQHYGIGRAGHR